MEYTFSVANASDCPHEAPVVLPVDTLPLEFSQSPETSLTLFREDDSQRSPWPVQLDEQGPRDNPDRVLCFVPRSPIPPQSTVDLVLVTSSKQASVASIWRCSGANVNPERVDLYNDQIFVSFSLASQQFSAGPPCFAGSAQSVRLRGGEFLDTFAAEWTVHSPEKRCMQVDKIRLWQGDSKCDPEEQPLCNVDCQLMSCCTGPVRTAVTVAQPIHLRRPEADGWFYRVLSLFRGTSYITDELSLKTGPVPENAVPCADLSFSARYFSHVDMGDRWGDPWDDSGQKWPEIWRQGTAWIALSYPHGDADRHRPGYGFASNALVEPVQHPHPEYPLDRSDRERTFSWEIGRSQGAKCLHLFTRRVDVGDQMGKLWDRHIYRPPKGGRLAMRLAMRHAAGR